jgi:uncharacterized membrane protein YeaQ/YmgE (transglycosylase-associated protein family)
MIENMMTAYIASGLALDPGDLLAWIIVGLIAGFLASAVIRGRGYGCIGNIIVGLIGSVVGGYLADLLNISGVYHFWGSVAIAFLGSCILVALLQFISGNNRKA